MSGLLGTLTSLGTMKSAALSHRDFHEPSVSPAFEGFRVLAQRLAGSGMRFGRSSTAPPNCNSRSDRPRIALQDFNSRLRARMPIAGSCRGALPRLLRPWGHKPRLKRPDVTVYDQAPQSPVPDRSATEIEAGGRPDLRKAGFPAPAPPLRVHCREIRTGGQRLRHCRPPCR